MTKEERIAYDFWKTGLSEAEVAKKNRIKQYKVRKCAELFPLQHFNDKRGKCFRSISIIYRKLQELADNEELNKLENIAALLSKY